ncbi:T9SS type A sorting domain-containing protein [Ferruginibacter profundus]
MKIFITVALVFTFSTSFSQWTRIQQLPPSEIASFYHKGDTLYAGGKGLIYISRNNGLTWDSTSTILQAPLVTSIIVYKNELYAAAPNRGVVKSADGGTTWQEIFSGNDTLDVSDFCEFKGELYATTFGQFIYKLNPVNGNSWLPFSNGLSSLSSIVNAIACTSTTMVAGTSRNGIYDYLPASSNTWEERTLQPQVSSFEAPYDITTAHDTLFWAGTTGKFFISTDKGLSWTLFGNRLNAFNTSLVNAKQALLAAVYFTDFVNFNTVFLYIKKDSLQTPFRSFSVVTDHFTWKIDIVGNKIWDASDKGLFFMSLSDLPGITNAEDSVPPILPVRFTSFTANCQSHKVILTWKTAQEQNSNHYDVERSVDGIHWTVIGSKAAAGNSSVERTYSFTDDSPLQNNLYRIVEYDVDGRTYQTDTIRSSCNTTPDLVSVWPNPVHDKLFINIVSDNLSPATVDIFDSRGALVKTQSTNLLRGSNQLTTDMTVLATGIYSVLVKWNNGQIKKTIQVAKQ